MLQEPSAFFITVSANEPLGWYSVIPEIILKNLDKILGGDIDELAKEEEFNKNISRFRMIPFSSLGKQNGLLLGIKADSVNIILDEKIETIKNVIIGIYDKSFTKNGTYSAIFGLDMLENNSSIEKNDMWASV